MNRTTATLFVDDYVTGATPGICVSTGEPTSDRLTMSTEIDGPSPAWILLLLFPLLGWLVLAVVLAASRRAYLTGTLPVSAAAFEATRRKRRLAKLSVAGGLIALVLATSPWLGAARGVVAVTALAAFLGGIAMLIVIDVRSPKVLLDGSRRWVTITRVHPEFARAVEATTRVASLDRSDG